MVKPAGTGKPKLVISARLAPFPPSSARIEASPSVPLGPNEYTYFSAMTSASLLTVPARHDKHARLPLPASARHARVQGTSGAIYQSIILASSEATSSG